MSKTAAAATLSSVALERGGGGGGADNVPITRDYVVRRKNFPDRSVVSRLIASNPYLYRVANTDFGRDKIVGIFHADG